LLFHIASMRADTLRGFVAPGFGAVGDAFAANFDRYGDVGAACAIFVDGDPVVDLHGGFADRAQTRPWSQDTITLIFSATKGVTAVCIHLLAERGLVDLDAPVARYWPEFAADGKGAITLRWVLSHRAGLAAVDGELSLDEVLAWDPVVRAIAAQAPNWTPGTVHGYHARSYGWILGEVVRRVSGRSVGRFLRDEVAGPLGLDLQIGLAATELHRFAPVIPPAAGLASLLGLLGADSLTARVMTGPSALFSYDEMWNRPDLLAAEMPSSNGVGNARSLAALYAALIGEVGGRRLLSEATVEAATTEQASGPDRVLFLPSRYALGFMLPPSLEAGCGPRAFGHPGAGGSLGFADPETGLSFGYVTTRMRFDATGDPRARGLVEAVYRSLRRPSATVSRRRAGSGGVAGETLRAVRTLAARLDPIQWWAGATEREIAEAPFQRDVDFLRRILPLMETLAGWFDAEVRGSANVPPAGPVLLVGNHSGGVLTPDTSVFFAHWYRTYGIDRPLVGLAFDAAFGIPGFRRLMRRIGEVPANRANARRALSAGQAVLVYPGGEHEAFRPWWERDRIDFDGRSGFVRLALRLGVPVVPVVGHGGHHSTIILSRGEWLAPMLDLARIRMRGLPIALQVPWGISFAFVPGVPLPAKITMQICPPMEWSALPPEAADDPAIVARCCDEIVARMQATLDALAAEHPRPVLGRLRGLVSGRSGPSSRAEA